MNAVSCSHITALLVSWSLVGQTHKPAQGFSSLGSHIYPVCCLYLWENNIVTWNCSFSLKCLQGNISSWPLGIPRTLLEVCNLYTCAEWDLILHPHQHPGPSWMLKCGHRPLKCLCTVSLASQRPALSCHGLWPCWWLMAPFVPTVQ